jgi:hypothetical protein
MLNKCRTSLNSNKLKSMYYRCTRLKSMLLKITKIGLGLVKDCAAKKIRQIGGFYILVLKN